MEFSSTTIYFFILAFISEIIGTISGFGSSVFFVPLAGMLFDLKTTLALTGILHIFSTSAQVLLFRKDIDWKLMVKIGIPSIVFVLLGAHLNKTLNIKYAEVVMGLFLIAFALIFLVKKDLKFRPTGFNAIIGGALAGFLAGLIGTGGAIRGATLASFNLPRDTFVGTSAGIDFGVDVSRTIVYLHNGYLDKKYYWFIPVMLLLAYAGAFVGKKVLKRIPDEVFKKIVLTLIFSIGVVMIFGFMTNKEIIK